MRLDWDLCRTIMLDVEARDAGDDEQIALEIVGFDDRTIGYHVRKLGDGGYLEVEELPDTDDPSLTWYVPTGLSYRGHEWLAATRQNTVWESVLRTVGGKVGSATMDTLFKIASAEIERRLGL